MSAQQHPPHEFDPEQSLAPASNPSDSMSKQRGSSYVEDLNPQTAWPDSLIDERFDRPTDGRPRRFLAERRLYSFLVRQGYAGRTRVSELFADSQVKAREALALDLKEGEEAHCFGWVWSLAQA